MSDLEKFLEECEPIELTVIHERCDDNIKKLIAMVKYLRNRHVTAEFIDDELNKIARGEK